MNPFLQYFFVVTAFFLAIAMNLVGYFLATCEEIYVDSSEKLLPDVIVRLGSGMTANFLCVVCLISLDVFNRFFEPRFLPVTIYLFCGLFILWIVYKTWEIFCALSMPISWILLYIVLESFVRDGVFMDKAHPGIWQWFDHVARAVNTKRDVLYLFGLSSFIVGLFSSFVVFCIFLKKTVDLVRSGRLKFWS
jgi:hypothetical protein